MERPIVINGRAAVRTRISGVERWAREMALRLPALRPGRYVVIRPPRALAHRAGQGWEQLLLPLRAASIEARAILSPANLAPVASKRNLVVIHDVAALRHPEWYSPAYVRWQRAVMPAIARRALEVITPSSFSRGELVEVLGADPDRTTVVAGGVDERFSARVDPSPAARAHGLDRPYVLTLAGGHARKNLDLLGASATTLRGKGIELVAAGGAASHQASRKEVRGIRMLGYVREEHLPGLYSGAQAFAMPSREEGFGLPCLEAMASGCPVVAARGGALPETCGDAALLVDPDEPADMADALAAAIADEGVRRDLIERGRARAAMFTWARAAQGVDAVVNRCA